MSSSVAPTQGVSGSADSRLRRRGRALLLTESAFARCVGATLTGTFMTAMVLAFGGRVDSLGLTLGAGQVGAAGMLLANPIINRLRSRRRFCLIWLGVVRTLRLVVAALPLLIYEGVDPRSLYWPFVGCVFVSWFFGMSGEVSRQSWIAALVPPARRGRFISWRTMIGMLVHAAVLIAGGKLLDHSEALTGQPLLGLAGLISFGAVMGWIGWALLYCTPEPPMVQPRRPTGLLRSLALPFRRARFRPLLLLSSASALATGVCGGFFSYYMRNHLQMSWARIGWVDTAGLLAGMMCAPLFGRWADRFGARRVLTVTMIVKGVFPALWILVTPTLWPLAFVVVLARTFNSAGQVCRLRLSMNLSPARDQAAFLAMHLVLMCLGGAVGAVSGGQLSAFLERAQFAPVVAGFQVVPLHVLFLVSAVLRLACVPLLRFIREPRRSMDGGA